MEPSHRCSAGAPRFAAKYSGVQTRTAFVLPSLSVRFLKSRPALNIGVRLNVCDLLQGVCIILLGTSPGFFSVGTLIIHCIR